MGIIHVFAGMQIELKYIFHIDMREIETILKTYNGQGLLGQAYIASKQEVFL